MKRVRVRDYGVLKRDSNLLRPIASVGGPHRLHWRAAEAFETLARGVRAALRIELKAASGWRPHRWASRSEYEAQLVRSFGSIAEGSKYLAFDSPHETGLAVDLGVGGLWPTRSTIDAQRRRPLHAWLQEHAAEHGWVPYAAEPWHWEFPTDPAEYRDEAGADIEAPPLGEALICAEVEICEEIDEPDPEQC